MNNVELNCTPVRTTKGYNINSIILNDIPQNITSSFNSIEKIGFDEDIIKDVTKNQNTRLTYGNGEVAESQNNDKANVKLYLNIDKNSLKENIVFFKFNKKNNELVDNIAVEVQANCRGQVTFCYLDDYNDSEKDINKGYHNGIIRTIIHDNAYLQITVINMLNYQTTNLISIENHLDKNAKLKSQIVDFGGNSSVTNYYTNLCGANSENDLNSIYLGTQKQFFDINYIASAKGENTKMIMDVQGALTGSAKKHFKGTIDFKSGCKKSIGNENEFCTLLSDEAKSISLPMLLCDEEDVVGNHSAAAGKVNKEELFYLMSRGFSEKEAKMLMVKAKFNKVIDSINNETLKNLILADINKKLEIDGCSAF